MKIKGHIPFASDGRKVLGLKVVCELTLER